MSSRARAVLKVLGWLALLDNCKVQASDGCGPASWKCGDICIDEDAPCHCGGDKIDHTPLLNEDWCCSDEPCKGLGDKGTNDKWGWSEGGNCSSGKVLPFSQPCKGKCNDNRKDIYQDDRSYIPCKPVTENGEVSQCIPQADENDNQFTCLNRADENPFSRKSITRSGTLDLSELLTNCTMGPGARRWNWETGEYLEVGEMPGLACPK